MKTFYHVTLKRNFLSIMEHGLIPKVGSRSKKLKEGKCIFLFPSIDDMENALYNWLGEEFAESTVLAALEIKVPDDFPILDSTVEYERISKVVIPSEYITYLRDE